MRVSLFLAVLGVAASASAQVSIQKVLMTGEQAPGMDPGTLVTFASFLKTGAGGHFILKADTSLFGGPDLSVGYRGTTGNMALWFLGGPAPGTEPGVMFYSLSVSGGRITPDGAAVAFCELEGPGVQPFNRRAIYVVHPDGSMHLALRDGQPAPQWGDATGVDFGVFAGTNQYTIADDLRFVKPVLVEGNPVIYAGFASDPRIQIRVGGPAPGLPGATVTGIRFYDEARWKFAGAGKIILRGTIEGPGVDSTTNEAIWGGELDSLQVLLRKGDPIPGLHPGNRATFTGDLGTRLNVNDAGQAVLWSKLVWGAGDTTAANDGVALTGVPGNLTVAARKGDQVPGLPPGVVYGDVPFGHIADGGVLFLEATLAGPGVSAANHNEDAILTGLPGALTVRMREGQQVPGLSSRFVFAGDWPDDPVFNSHGAFVLRTAIRDLAFDDTYISSVIYWPAGGGDPTVLMRNDQTIEVAPGDVREFDRAWPVGLSDAGEIFINVRFDEDSEVTGVFVATIGSSGACCSGTMCSVGAQAECTGEFQGQNTACGALGNPTTCCNANFNQIGGVTVQDIFDFLVTYFAGDPRADFDESGAVGVQDIFDFLVAYFAGCN